MSIDVDFSLALNDRTGKLFLGKDIISTLGGQVSRVRYGRWHEFPHSDLMRRVVGRLTHKETLARVYRSPFAAVLPVIRDPRPTLHLDPLSVVRHRLEPRDIVLCHDVGPITHPQYFAPGVDDLYLRAYDQIRRVKPHMVFVSKTSQQEFHRLYGCDFASSKVIYIPTRLGVKDGEAKAVDGVGARFLLTVGSVGDRKNQARCIEAFAASRLAQQGWQYVVVGGREPGADTAINLARQTPGVVLPGYTTDEQLRWLYRNAFGFVLMSLLEGFGMPVIEAIEHDLPCLVSRSSILTEVGGDAMLDADPLELESIAMGMQALAAMPADERQRRIDQARRHLQIFAREPILACWRELIERMG
ncbi:glycosyltransferase [Paraburkholderia tropica]|uniref:Glycosyltransferase involved in cell wall biosynthesis n=1 Tax=Paraburkholderia tropica TaxID=92647 RepID=A0ABX5MXT2_9BURK|nr:glycosyltransferase [Paraburkholderia tropica]PXX20819.1 glycosyltransferase involved in cell wall biosynthesis [Paraburkholderia tropica]PZW89896.1 glycosyltransferase involved in cell wall biosynthesis [Paraburkholderia tropica]